MFAHPYCRRVRCSKLWSPRRTASSVSRPSCRHARAGRSKASSGSRPAHGRRTCERPKLVGVELKCSRSKFKLTRNCWLSQMNLYSRFSLGAGCNTHKISEDIRRYLYIWSGADAPIEELAALIPETLRISISRTSSSQLCTRICTLILFCV